MECSVYWNWNAAVFIIAFEWTADDNKFWVQKVSDVSNEIGFEAQHCG